MDGKADIKGLKEQFDTYMSGISEKILDNRLRKRYEMEFNFYCMYEGKQHLDANEIIERKT